MPAMLRRVTGFCTRYNTDVDVKHLVRLVESHFVVGTGHVQTWALCDGADMVGHILCYIEQRGPTRVGFVLQFESDRPIWPPSLWDELPTRLATWGRAQGASCLEACSWLSMKTLNRYGFRYWRTVVRKDL